MKKITVLIVATLVSGFVSSAALAAQSPLVRLTIKNHEELISAVSKVVESAKPGMGQMIGAMAPAFLGSPELAGVDVKRPWQVVGWSKGMQQRPAFGIYVPVTDGDAFKAGLGPGILLGGNGQNTVATKNGYAIIYDGNQKGFTDLDRDQLLNWTVAPSGFADRTINVRVTPDEEMRKQFVEGIDSAKSAVMGGVMMGLQNAPNKGAMNPEGMADMMDVYFSIIETAVKGMAQLDFGLAVADGDIVVSETVVPAANSPLAGWFAANPNGVAADAAAMDWDSTAAFAFSMRDDPALSGFLEKMMAASMKLQNLKAEDIAAEESLKLMKDMMPAIGAVSVDFGKSGLGFSGSYRFPGRDGEKMRGLMKKWLDENMGKQVGEGKPYSAFDYNENVGKIGGSSVNRMTLVYNFDAPMFSMPGQKEQIEAMFPGGKMVFDSVTVEDRMHFVSGGKLEDSINAAKSGMPAGIKAGPRTTFIGQLNMVAMIKQMAGGNPGAIPIPPAVLASLDPAGTAIRFQADQNGNLDAKLRIPLKLISTFARAGEAAAAAR